MIIYKMTATFGKLEHQTLTLEPGLNIIAAPNEWGKSTWCAFLLAMLYGIDSRSRTTKTALADKDRYAPWSGAPMAGRIDLCWQGRNITIERTTRGRVPMGQFRACETESGLPVPELNALNCGQMLLGVEQTVFRRAGFIRHADLPVTQDEALRRRLNDLVTTGDESGAADQLAEKLRDLKNRVRYNRTGLLPAAESERDAIAGKLRELESLEEQSIRLKTKLEEMEAWLSRLNNHKQQLKYRESEQDALRLAAARQKLDLAKAELARQEEICSRLPDPEMAEEKWKKLKHLREELAALMAEKIQLSPMPQKPGLPQPYAGKTLEQAKDMVAKDRCQYRRLTEAWGPKWMILLGLLGLNGGIWLIFMDLVPPGMAAFVAAVAAVLWGISNRRSMKKQAMELMEKYGNRSQDQWEEPLTQYAALLNQYERQKKAYLDANGDVEVRLMVLRRQQESLCGTQNLETATEFWQKITEQWSARAAALGEVEKAQHHVEDLQAMAKPMEKIHTEDSLTYGKEETEYLLAEGLGNQQKLLGLLGQCQGRMEALGNREQLFSLHAQKEQRIARLEQTYSALTIAQETLEEARSSLQRRFAPKIAARAQELLEKLTDGRYHSLAMGTDFSLRAGAGEESVLSDALWRSDGTVDQLYLALRLAVAEALTPEAPVILDDALVRFDDGRMQQAVEILREMGEEKQVILFTCQGREKEYLEIQEK